MAKYDYALSIEHERATEDRKAMIARIVRRRADRERTLTRKGQRAAKRAAQTAGV